MEPAGRVPSNFGDYRDQVYLVRSATFATGCHFPLGTLGNLQHIASPDILAKYKGRSEKARRVGKGTGETWVEQ